MAKTIGRRAPRPNPNLWPYAIEKLGAAVYVLSTHPAEIRWRLLAASEHLAMVPAAALPPNLRDVFEDAFGEMTKKKPAAGGSRISFNLRRRRQKTLVRIAEQIVRVYEELQWIDDHQDRERD